MSNPISVMLSPRTNRIFSGRSIAVKGLAPVVRQIVGDKFDVTDDACHAVAFHLMKAEETVVYELPDGKELHLSVSVKDSLEATHD
ncbi:hypothetical protein [Enterobacter kobei]|uniref:DUF7446 family protein n=1 Tax=Enterobacter kobei TaxID=208224 RepID=UPI003A970055